MSASNAFGALLGAHLFNNAAMTNYGSSGGLPAATTAGTVYVSLHTASPGVAGTQTTSEAVYTGYARVAMVFNTTDWAVAGMVVSNAIATAFPTATGGSETETYFAIGQNSTGAGDIFLFGALTSSLAVSNGITPSFPVGQLTTTIS